MKVIIGHSLVLIQTANRVLVNTEIIFFKKLATIKKKNIFAFSITYQIQSDPLYLIKNYFVKPLSFASALTSK